jgi:hypothetical protein
LYNSIPDPEKETIVKAIELRVPKILISQLEYNSYKPDFRFNIEESGEAKEAGEAEDNFATQQEMRTLNYEWALRIEDKDCNDINSLSIVT